MGSMARFQAVQQYQNAGVVSATAAASPEQLIAMLLGGALDRVARAKGATLNGDVPGRTKAVGSTIAILEYLRLCLDPRGGQLTQRLDALYDFALRRLAQANGSGDVQLLDDVAAVLRPLKSAWDEIRPSAPR